MNASRRQFLAAALATPIAAAVGTKTLAAEAAAGAEGPKFKKAVKFDMIKTDSSIREKFELIKSLGFLGVEMNSPSDIDHDEAVAAQEMTGVKIHGVIDSVHWKERLSDPDPAIRARGLQALRTAIGNAKVYGADTVLLVPGAVRDPQNENFEQVWERSTAEIKKAIPWAEEAGTKIAIEVVWNDFITKPEQLVKYVDQFNSAAVGAYFDVSNMIKYGVPPADWIRALGKRMLKFDFKGYSHEKKWVDIGEGDENWSEVLKALDEIGYRGWATSEVKGGGEKELAEISKRMDRVLGLA